MTQTVIDDIIPRTQLIASSGQQVFNCNWTADDDTDILVYARASGVDPDDATQIVNPSLYNVSFVGSSRTVRVTFLSGRTLGDIITIVRNTPATRMNLYINTNFVPSMLNQDFGILTLVDQQAQMYDEVINPGYNVSAIIQNKDKKIPTLGAQQVWRMNEDETAIEAYTLDDTPAATNAPYVIYKADAHLEDAFNLGGLTSGILKQTVNAGVSTPAIASLGTDYYGPGMSTTIPVDEGGTGADNASDARDNLGLGTMAIQDANNVAISGGTAILTAGQVINAPSAGSDIVNKSYADSLAAGFTFKSSCFVSSTSNLNATYNNGASGVGATLTANSNGVLTIDGETPGVSARILVQFQTADEENGIYQVSDAGSVSTPYVLTRSTDFDSSAEILPGSIIFITDGSTYANVSFVQTEVVLTVGTDPIVFVQFSASYPLSMGNGGTGNVLIPSNGKLVYSTATNLALLNTTADGVLVTDLSGIPSISQTLPSGLTIPGYAASGSNSDITELLGLTGPLQAPTGILDSNGNEIMKFSGVASAVNEFTFTNAATGNAPKWSASGGDPNIGLLAETKGTGQYGVRSANTTTPFYIDSGTGFQHKTNFLISNTANTRNVTLQDADGTLAYLADRGYVLISSASASNSAAITFTNISGYSSYVVVVDGARPATNGSALAMLASSNNGSSFYNSSGDYFTQVMIATNTTTNPSQSKTIVYYPLSSSIINTVRGYVGVINLTGFSTTERKGVIANGVYIESSVGNMVLYQSYGYIIPAAAINAITFLMTVGNITSGTFYLYGMK